MYSFFDKIVIAEHTDSILPFEMENIGWNQDMYGDDMKNSLWRSSSSIQQFPALAHDVQTDVLIVGGGLAGILCAYKLQQEGVSYTLLEADRVCHGVTGNTTAKITAQHGLIYHKLLRSFSAEEAKLYWKANTQALEVYEGLAQTIDCSFERKDNFIYSRTAPQMLEKELKALETLQIPAEYKKDLPLPFETVGAVCFRNQAQFHPIEFAAGICKGLNIYEKTAVKEFRGNTAVTDKGQIRASKIIVATHFPILNKHGGYFMKMYQQRSYVLALKQAGQLDGMYLEEGDGGLSLRNHGEFLLLGGGGHRTGKPGGGWETLEQVSGKYYPEAPEKFRWATQDCMTLDGLPYIGYYSKRTPDLFVATGFNKWGMTSSMVSAMVLTDMILGKENPYASLFSPSRSVLHPQLMANGAEAVKSLLIPTKPRCPHLGCVLKWNAQEHSWDCPCHGSRFDEDGTLLDNPATGNMKKE